MVPPTSDGHSGVDREWFGNTNLKNSSLLGDARGVLRGFESWKRGVVGLVACFLDGRLGLFWVKDRVPTAVTHGYIYLTFGLD